MPFVFMFLGLALLTVAVRGTHKEAADLLRSEWTGPGSFMPWALAIFILGGLSYVPIIRPLMRAFLLLVILVIVLKNGAGLFDRFNEQIKLAGAASPAPSDSTGPAGTSPAGPKAPVLPAIAPLPGLPALGSQGNVPDPVTGRYPWEGTGTSSGGMFDAGGGTSRFGTPTYIEVDGATPTTN